MNPNVTDYPFQDFSGLNCDRGEIHFCFRNPFWKLSLSRLRIVISFCLGLYMFSGKVDAQTDFAPGDIMFIGFDSDDADGFSFVLLSDVLAGTTIYLTDRGWDNAAGDGFRDDMDGEGTIKLCI